MTRSSMRVGRPGFCARCGTPSGTQRTPPRLEELVRVHRELSKAAQRLKAAQRGASLFDRSMFEELVALAMGVAAKVVG